MGVRAELIKLLFPDLQFAFSVVLFAITIFLFAYAVWSCQEDRAMFLMYW